MQIVVITSEHVIRLDADIHIQIARDAAIFADLTLISETQTGVVRHAGRHRDADIAGDAHAAMAEAGRARLLDDRSMAFAAFAWRGGHHLYHALRISLTVAVGTLCGLCAVLAAGAAAFLAQAERVDLDVRGVAEHRRLQIAGRGNKRVTPRLGARSRSTAGATESATGEHAEDVPHIAESATESAAVHAARIRIVRIDAGIVHLPFLRIRQHIVRVVDFLELVFEFRTCDVGMVFAAHLSIRLFDLVVACRTVDAQHFVIVRHDYSFSA